MSEIPITPFTSLPLSAQRTLDTLITEYRRLTDEIAALSLSSGLDSLIAARNEISSTLKDLALELSASLDIRKVPCYFIRMSRTTTSINPNKLAERGVSIDTIEYATERKESKPWVEILDAQHAESEPNLSAFD